MMTLDSVSSCLNLEFWLVGSMGKIIFYLHLEMMKHDPTAERTIVFIIVLFIYLS